MELGGAARQLPADDDATLVRRVVGGDQSAFAHLMRRYNRRLYRLARAALRDDAEAHDALQDAYLCAYRSLAQFRGECALSTWLSRLVLNTCGARRRRSLRRAGLVSIVSSDQHVALVEEVADAAEQPDRLAARAHLRTVLERKLCALPEIFRVVFVLRSVEELSVEEVAGILGISAETVRSRHFRAKGMLRESLAQEIDLAEGDIFEFGGEHCDRVVAGVLARLASG